MLQSLAAHYGFDLDKPYAELPEAVHEAILQGSGREKIRFTYIGERGNKYVREHPFEGVLPNLERRYRETESLVVREELAKYLNTQSCAECGGTRLRREARHVTVAGKAIYEVSALPLAPAIDFFQTLTLPGVKQAIAEKIVREIVNRLQFLVNVGLEYLSLDRAADTLSGGEAQRIRLASQIGSGLTGVMYVLDEPSIGLHQRDNARLLETLKRLRDIGNSVIVVEHDHEAIMAADHVVDMGLGAGEHGGRVVAEGTPGQIAAHPDSLTGQYLSGRRRIDIPALRHRANPKRELVVAGATGNNLKGVTARVPVGLFVCVTGVSGSGKSTLVNDTLYSAVARQLYGSAAEAAPHESIEGLELLRQGRQRRPESHRPHAPVESGDLHRIIHADPRAFRRRARPRASADTAPGAFPSTSKADAAKRARATACSKSRCISCPTSTCRATYAMGGATTAKRWKSSTRARTSTKCCR